MSDVKWRRTPQYGGLRRLLDYVWNRSPFYKDFYSSHGIRERDLREVSVRDLPRLTKTTLMDNFDLAVTDTRLKKLEIERWIQSKPDPRERFSEGFVVVHSSGTSGSLGIFVYSSREWIMPDSALAFRLPEPENNSSGKTRAAFYIAAHGHFAFATSATSLASSRYDTQVLSLLDPSEHNIRLLNTFQPHQIYGYASSVTALAEMSLEGALRIRPSQVFVGGDKLFPGMAEKIHRAWSPSVFETYGSSESKYIAFSSGASTMTVLAELNLVEVLDDAGNGVRSGQEGQVVLTNLYNYTLPVIRYECGDYVKVGETNGDGFVASIQEIRGRANEALPVAIQEGTVDTIHPIVLSEFHVPGLEKVQFRSRRPDFIEVCYTAASDLDSSIRSQFQRMLDAKRAASTTFEVRRLDRIENNPKTGKFDLVQRGHVEAGSRTTYQPGARPLEFPAAEPLSFLKGENVKWREVCAHELFQEQAARSGDAIAVICGEKRLTYAELNARANRLARYLRGIGVGPESLVAICLTRSVDLFAGILAILKAGGAWVPMDSRHPRERKETVLDSTKAAFLITERPLASDFPGKGIHTIVLDELWQSVSSQSDSNLENLAVPSNLAYVMFTSGSTGQPKGVMINHANLSQYVFALGAALAVTPRDIYLHTASAAFSSSVRQLFLPLASGATSVIATVDHVQEPLTLFETIRNQQVTILDMVPSYWRNCMEALSTLDDTTRGHLLTNHVRLIATASETLRSELPERWRRDFKHGARVINMFGQTETTGIVTTYPIPPEDPLDLKSVPIGKPIANSCIYLLDEHRNVVPVGSLGEIYIGGPGVGRGYLNQPESTGERFLPTLFTEVTTDLFYRTGDLGRCRPDGSIEFIGRLDDQIKIRGIRIEPDEVTAALSQHPDLKECVVLGQTDEGDDRRLVAYVVPSDGRKVASGALRKYLAERLPDYMVPSAFISIETLPRLASGKIDRHALPVLDRVRPGSSPPLIPPRTDMEKQLLELWRAVLGIVSISILDNFFDLGGSSLSAMNFLIHVNKRFGEKLSMASLYMAPTVEEFAQLIEQRQPQTNTSLLPLQPEGHLPPFFWIHGDFSNTLLPRYLGSDQPVFGLGHQGLDGTPAKFTTVETIAAHYLEEMRTVQSQGPYYIGGYCFGGLIAFEIAHQLKTSGEDVRLLAVLEPNPLHDCGGTTLCKLPPPQIKHSGPRDNIVRHWTTMKTLGLQRAVPYFTSRVSGTIMSQARRVTRPISNFVMQRVCNICVRYNLTLPVWVRNFYIMGIYRVASRTYNLRTYPGKVALFARESPDLAPSTWEGLASHVEIHQVNSESHTSMLRQPDFGLWVEKLKGVLKKAQKQ